MDIFFINLSSRKDRLNNIVERLPNGYNCLRIPAITPYEVSYFLEDNSIINTSNLNIRELACYCSHYKALKEISNRSTLILEDDCEFEPDFITKLLKIVKTDYDIIHLGLYKRNIFPQGMEHQLYRPQTEWLGHSYLVNPKAVNFLLNKLKNLDRSIDHALYMLQYDLVIYDVRPPLTYQDETPSSIR